MHLTSPFFSVEESALFPKTNPNAPNKIDFPAPVSPVIMDNPEEKSMYNSLMSA